MKFATKEITWKHDNPAIGEQSFTVQVREPETHEDRIVLCGTEDRINDIITQKLLNFANSSKTKFSGAEDLASAQLVIAKVIEAGLTVDLTQTRGEGVQAQVKELGRLKTILEDPNSTKEQKLEALAAMGYNL